MDIVTTSNQLNDIQIKLDKILNNCQNLSLPYEQIQSALERIEQLNIRTDNLQIQLTPPPPPPPPTTTTNGYHHSSKRQVNNLRVMQTVLIDMNKCDVFLSIHILNILFFLRGTL